MNYALAGMAPLALQMPPTGTNPFTRNLLAGAMATAAAPQFAQDGRPAPQSGVGAFGPPSIGGAFSAQSSGSIPDYAGGIRQAFADNAAKEPPVKRLLGMRADTVAGVLGTLGDALMAYGGLQPSFASMVAQQKQHDAERDFQREKWASEIEAERQKRMAPRPEQVGSTLGIFDPSSLSFDEVWREPTEPEQYATALGVEPGTEEWAAALREYRAGTWNPVGVEGRLAVQAPRLETTERGQDLRYRSTVRGQDIRSTDTRRGQDVTDRRVRESAGFRGSGNTRGRADRIGPIYQRDGKRIQFSKSAGGYVDLATGQRVN